MSRLSIAEAIQRVVGVLSDTGDTDQVLSAVATSARRMMLADEAYILLRDGGRLVLRASDGLPEGLLGRSFVRMGEGLEGWVAEHGEALAISDAFRERRFRNLPWRDSRVSFFAAAPMKLRDDIVGVLATVGSEPFPPVGSRLTGLEILAGIGAVTLENDRLLHQERRRAHQAEILRELASIQDAELWPFLQRVADAINSSLGVEDTVLMLLDGQGNELVCTSEAGCSGSQDNPASHLPERLLDSPWAETLMATGEPIMVADTTDDPGAQSEFLRTGVRSLIAVPIRIGGEQKGLVRVATRDPGSFRSEDLAFVSMMAAQVGLSVERNDLARRQLEVSREQARQQARQEFLGLVSHELKTPVAVLKAYTELLMRRAEVDEARASDRDVLGRMVEQSDRMLAMIEQLLDLQKLEAGSFPLEISHFDLAELARKVAENLQQAAPSHRILFRATGPLMVLADRRRIEEVLFNLVENGLKYSLAGSEVVVTTAFRADPSGTREAEVAVADQGIGIAERDLPRVFERFFQGQGRFLRGHVGLGLGLYIAKETVERHGGRIWAESAQEKGSTLRFTLPLPADGATPEE